MGKVPVSCQIKEDLYKRFLDSFYERKKKMKININQSIEQGLELLLKQWAAEDKKNAKSKN